MKKDDFWVECNVCKRRLKNWVGSTPCCGSIAWLVEGEKVTNKIIVYACNGLWLGAVPHKLT